MFASARVEFVETLFHLLLPDFVEKSPGDEPIGEEAEMHRTPVEEDAILLASFAVVASADLAHHARGVVAHVEVAGANFVLPVVPAELPVEERHAVGDALLGNLSRVEEGNVGEVSGRDGRESIRQSHPVNLPYVHRGIRCLCAHLISGTEARQQNKTAVGNGSFVFKARSICDAY